ncbi:MAG: hypothetical protein H7251_17735 [Acetobacteraceae bacterium]|nr:hypothetical protein [Acetobacteraceae bacterium]
MSETGDWGPTTDPATIARELASDFFYAEVDRIRFTEGNLKGANTFATTAQGLATPVLHYVNAWIAEGGKRGPVNPRTAHQYRRDVGEFADWLTAEGLPGTLEAVTAP